MNDVIWSKDEWFIPDPAVKDIAVRIWVLFDERKKQYQANARPCSRKQGASFYKAALRCMELEMDPETFVEVALQRMAETGIFFPQALGSGMVVNKAEDVLADQQAHLAGKYIAMGHLLQSMAKMYGVRLALEDKSNAFTPLFIYAIALNRGMPDLLAQVEDAAREEYFRYPIQKEIWGEMFHA